MKYTVYHARVPVFGLSDGNTEFNEANFEKVAEVETLKLDSVFQITNHNNGAWQSNPEVRWFKGGQVRSTSIGDVVVDGDGQNHRCAFCGWESF